VDAATERHVRRAKAVTDLETFRRQKDHFFKHDRYSPLLPEQKGTFAGLSYYVENPALRFELDLEPFEAQEPVMMQTSTGTTAEYIRYGRVRFEVGGEPVELTVFAAPGGGGFFLPFMDATSGEETYSGGRYLEIDPLPGGRFAVDFNMAYNPYCAYNEPQSLAARAGRSPQTWTCPIPPKENRLKVPIWAGEKLPVGDWVEHG
jgi:hypothetical protein